VNHDGAWYTATLLDAWRGADGWRAVVRYSTAPGWQYVRAVSYDEVRPDDQEAQGCNRKRRWERALLDHPSHIPRRARIFSDPV
jgi:hypothetical protein